MSYSTFTLRKAKELLNLKFIEGIHFFPDIEPVEPSPSLAEFLQESIPLALAMGTEKARSELIISPILFEVRKKLNRQISFFSGEEFNVDESIGLNGVCDFLISRSPEQLFVESPVVIIVEAKKDDLKGGLGQCIAEMVAAQKFNEMRHNFIEVIYGCVTTGNRWIFLKLQDQNLSLDLEEYIIPPVNWLLATLIWIIQSSQSSD